MKYIGMKSPNQQEFSKSKSYGFAAKLWQYAKE